MRARTIPWLLSLRFRRLRALFRNRCRAGTAAMLLSLRGRNPCLLLLGFACAGGFIADATGVGEGRPIFRSGFEPDSTLIPRGSGVNDDIRGVDHSVAPPNDWVNDLEGYPKVGFFNIQYQGGEVEDRFARIIPDPTREDNHVLHFWMKNPRTPSGSSATGYKGRIQANVYNNTDLTEVYQKRRLYLHPDMELLREYPERFIWLTIEELWLAAGWIGHPYPFRIKVDLSKEQGAGKPLRFSVHAQRHDERWITIWNETDRDFEVPIAQWITLETYYRQGDDQNGRFYFAVTPEGGERKVIFDVAGWTYSPVASTPTPMTDWNPMKMYTSDTLVNHVRESGGVLQLYFDDWEVWDGPPPVFYDDFSILPTGEFPGEHGDWTALENPAMARIDEFEGTRGLTFDTPAGERARLERAFRISESAGELIVRFTVRFPFSTADNAGMKDRFVPAVRILGGDGGEHGDIELAFQSNGRIRVDTHGPDGETLSFDLDAFRDDGVDRYHGGGAFEAFTDLTLTYNRSTGRTTLKGAPESGMDVDFADYAVEWAARAGMEFDKARILSTGTGSNDGGHSENFSQIGEFGIFERLEILPDIPAEFSINRAVELHINTEDGLYYFIEHSNDLEEWKFLERFRGAGDPISRFYTPQPNERRFFRVFQAADPGTFQSGYEEDPESGTPDALD